MKHLIFPHHHGFLIILDIFFLAGLFFWIDSPCLDYFTALSSLGLVRNRTFHLRSTGMYINIFSYHQVYCWRRRGKNEDGRVDTKQPLRSLSQMFSLSLNVFRFQLLVPCGGWAFNFLALLMQYILYQITFSKSQQRKGNLIFTRACRYSGSQNTRYSTLQDILSVNSFCLLMEGVKDRVSLSSASQTSKKREKEKFHSQHFI